MDYIILSDFAVLGTIICIFVDYFMRIKTSVLFHVTIYKHKCNYFSHCYDDGV